MPSRQAQGPEFAEKQSMATRPENMVYGWEIIVESRADLVLR
jgi:hypothetical protein